jgi:hypothetical protein
VKRHHGGGSIRLKFATENHSIALVERAANKRGQDGHSLSHTRLRPPKRNQRSTNNDEEEKKEEMNVDRSSSSRCLAHTMLFCEEMGGVEVFAMEGERKTDTANHTVTDCDNEVATASGNDGGDNIIATTHHHRRQTSVDTAVTTSNQSSAMNVDNEVAANVTTVENMKYWLDVKDCSTNDVLLSTIPLDFCPMLVHLAEIDISTIDNGDEEESNDDEGEGNDVSDGSSFSPRAIGIFISTVNDNTPRLYIATKEALRMRMRRDDGDQSDGSCFILVSLIDHIDAQNDDNDSASEQPLTFSTPIMAMDTIVTDVFPDKCSKKMNYLAMSCYDGMVRILTYRLIWNSKLRDNAEDTIDLPRLCPLRCSTFFVDGPVTSLNFGITTVISDIPLSRQSPSLFLVAGSLCGFACLFYESSRPSRSPNNVDIDDRYFDGPVTVVDGLYDGREGGYEDCVTSVHVVCHLDKGDRMIAVGTQGGRVLLFAWCEDEKRRFAGIRDEIITARHEMDEAKHRLDQTKEQISVLQTEKDEMGIKASNLHVIIFELQAKIDSSLNSSTTDNRKSVEEEEIKPQHDKESISNFELEIKAVETELASLQQSMYGHACILEELSSVVIDLVRQIDEKNDDIARRELQLPQMTRKLHRYSILCEKHLPYPIHGIASSAYQEVGGVGRDILVSTRRSFHIFRHHNSFDEGGHNIKCELLS